jgi:hypothetical protein
MNGKTQPPLRTMIQRGRSSTVAPAQASRTMERLGVALLHWHLPARCVEHTHSQPGSQSTIRSSNPMTSLIAWIGVDSRGPASAYLASDSRISWAPGAHWDIGRKLFTSEKSADLFGYCGDVLFPSLLLSQVSQMIFLTASSGANTTPAGRHEVLVAVARESLARHPVHHRRAFSMLHCGRESAGMSSAFHLWRTDWSPDKGWSDDAVMLPSESVLVLTVGLGESTVARYDAAWRKTEVGRTSRAVFSAFCEALKSGADHFSGGAPQLVGIYRRGHGETFGVIYQGERYVLGVSISSDQAGKLAVEWRNELFERCDGPSMERLNATQGHGASRDWQITPGPGRKLHDPLQRQPLRSPTITVIAATTTSTIPISKSTSIRRLA